MKRTRENEQPSITKKIHIDLTEPSEEEPSSSEDNHDDANNELITLDWEVFSQYNNNRVDMTAEEEDNHPTPSSFNFTNYINQNHAREFHFIDPDTNTLVVVDGDDDNVVLIANDNHEGQFLQNPTINIIKQIPPEIMIDLMFYMDKRSVFNFIQTCHDVYNLFDEIYSESIEKLRLDILNKRRGTRDLKRLLDLFSNPCQERNGEKVMMTYDQYFRVKSTGSWPSSYFHDNAQFGTVVKVGDLSISAINEQADLQMSQLNDLTSNEMEMLQKDSAPVFPYGLFPQKDAYCLTFEELVKRRCVKGMKELFSHGYSDKLWKIERVITPDLYVNETETSLSSIDYHVYADKPTNIKSVFLERIVRFFKHPYDMTFSDFENRFKNNVLSELARTLIYDCAFEYNKTTKTNERFVVSGGSILHCLTGCGCQDIDIFVISNGEPDEVVNGAIKQVLLKFEEKSSQFNYNIMSSKSTINICQERPRISTHSGFRVDINQNIQVVLLKYDTVEELLLFFDLDCCKLAYDGSNVLTVLECLRALKYKINFLPKETGNTEINMYRALKYGTRGFFTFTLDTDHPLSHAMHCDFIVEKIRENIMRKYGNENIMYRENPVDDLYVHPSSYTQLKPLRNPVDLDDSTYLYPLVLRNVDYHFVDLCKSIGLSSALWKLRNRISRYRSCFMFDFILEQNSLDTPTLMKNLKAEGVESGKLEMLEMILAVDQYVFVDRPSELFKTLPETHNFIKSKYSYTHLVNKYSMIICQKCSTYAYSRSSANQLRMSHRGVEIAFEKKDINENNYNPKDHVLCASCLKQVNGKLKKKAFLQSISEGRKVEDIELEMVQILKENKDSPQGVSKETLRTLLCHRTQDEFDYALLSLNFKGIMYCTIDDSHFNLHTEQFIFTSNYELVFQPSTTINFDGTM